MPGHNAVLVVVIFMAINTCLVMVFRRIQSRQGNGFGRRLNKAMKWLEILSIRHISRNCNILWGGKERARFHLIGGEKMKKA